MKMGLPTSTAVQVIGSLDYQVCSSATDSLFPKPIGYTSLFPYQQRMLC